MQRCERLRTVTEATWGPQLGQQISTYPIQSDQIPIEISRGLPKYPTLPATLLGRLARHSSTKGHGLGELLLLDAVYRALKMSEHVASAAIITDAKDQKAVDFYK